MSMSMDVCMPMPMSMSTSVSVFMFMSVPMRGETDLEERLASATAIGLHQSSGSREECG